jgi:hypothetical protein
MLVTARTDPQRWLLLAQWFIQRSLILRQIARSVGIRLVGAHKNPFLNDRFA